MNAKAFDAYRSRYLKLLEYIDSNLEENLSVNQLSIVVAFSKYHFHRQFSEFLGIAVYKYVQLNRLKRASYQLTFRDRPIVDNSIRFT